jgi:predicted nucleic acid-binding protein
VVDANILIDFHACSLLERLFRLPLKLIAPDLVAFELEDPKNRYLMELGLEVVELSPDQVRKLDDLTSTHRRLSISDLSALILAEEMRTVLLTNDGLLRKLAARRNIEIHGTLWLLDEMVKLKLITPQCASGALKIMLQKGSRLPKRECQRRFNLWANTSKLLNPLWR